jgi:hypothetical protein
MWQEWNDAHDGGRLPARKPGRVTAIHDGYDGIAGFGRMPRSDQKREGNLMNKSCSSCRFYLAETASAGICRRHPPVLIVVAGSPSSRHPGVSASGSCGEHSFDLLGWRKPIGRFCLTII